MEGVGQFLLGPTGEERRKLAKREGGFASVGT